MGMFFCFFFCLQPDNTPFSLGLLFACVAEPWSRVAHCAGPNTNPFVASQPLSTPQGLVMTSWKKKEKKESNVLPQITSLSLLAVNFLPCARTLQTNTVGKEYPHLFPYRGLLFKGEYTAILRAKISSKKSIRVVWIFLFFFRLDCQTNVRESKLPPSPLLVNRRLCRWSKELSLSLEAVFQGASVQSSLQGVGWDGGVWLIRNCWKRLWTQKCVCVPTSDRRSYTAWTCVSMQDQLEFVRRCNFEVEHIVFQRQQHHYCLFILSMMDHFCLLCSPQIV